MDNGISTHSHAKVHMTMLGKQEINLQWSKVLVEFYINDIKIVIAALYSVLLSCATVCYPSTEKLKCSNYMVSPSNAYLEENEKIHTLPSSLSNTLNCYTLFSTRFHY